MNQNQSGTTMTEYVAVKGFVRHDLKICFETEKTVQLALEQCQKIEEKQCQEAGVRFSGKGGTGYFIPKYQIAFEESDSYYPDSSEDKKGRTFLKPDRHLLTQEQARFLFIEKWDFFSSIKGLSTDKDKKSLIFIGKPKFFICCQGGKIDIRTETGELKHDDKSAHEIPCCSLTKDEFFKNLRSGAYKLLNRNNENNSDIIKHNKIIDIINKYYTPYVSAETIEQNDVPKILQNYQECTQKLIQLCNIRQETLNQAFEEYLQSEPHLNMLRTQVVLYAILHADKFRTDLPEFPFTEIERNGRGNWELFHDASDTSPLVKLNQRYTSRNPVSDYQENGIVGIDFGTKSTVVSSINDENEVKLIRIGSSNYQVKTDRRDYENPTVLEFIDIKSFLRAYYSSETNGRPYTSWKDIRNSYSASGALTSNDTTSNELDRFLSDIKQWCGDTSGTRILSICDTKGTAITFPSFQQCDEFKPFSEYDIVDPLEIYAYYLGLVINCNNEIYLNYQLSFPITYNKDIRNKMIESFERGLKKSLPEAILNNSELMQDFHVQAVRSEPAAYAICALDEYSFKPTPDQKEFYSVFDFGGGTTDMVFGIWRLSDKSNRDERNFDSIIEQFNQEGDHHLGGENLLELLAFEIFKANSSTLNKDGKIYCFTRPAECMSFPGSERLIQNESRSARRNTIQLVKALRPLWEGLKAYIPSEANNAENRAEKLLKGYQLKEKIDFLDTGYIETELEDENGNKNSVKIYLDSEEPSIFVDIISILENRIERGIISYFHALETALEDERAENISIVRLLLAGNSCKSPIVGKLFEEYIKKWTETHNHIEIKLYHPLGMKKYADEVRPDAESRSDAPDRPTGKTGVAYGLIKRSIYVHEEIDATDEAKFKFYLGHISENNFKVVINRDEDYGKWFYFGYPASGNFDLFYTNLPDAVSGKLSEKRVKRAVCRVRTPDRDKDIYIRLVTPDTIEYGMGAICSEPEGTPVSDEIQVTSLGMVHLIS